MTSEPGIRVSKRIAKAKIGCLLDRGEEIEQQLSNVQAIRTYEEFKRIQNEYCRWSGDSVSLLTRFFEDDSLAAQFSNLDLGTIGDNYSLLENKRTLRIAVKQRITWLNDLVILLDDFPQSPKTPTGGCRD